MASHGRTVSKIEAEKHQGRNSRRDLVYRCLSDVDHSLSMFIQCLHPPFEGYKSAHFLLAKSCSGSFIDARGRAMSFKKSTCLVSKVLGCAGRSRCWTVSCHHDSEEKVKHTNTIPEFMDTTNHNLMASLPM